MKTHLIENVEKMPGKPGMFYALQIREQTFKKL